MSGDRVIRFTTVAVVCAVAAFAAVVSYSHIYGLGRAHGQDGTAARLLPLSVDGLILAASLVLLHEARNGRDAPRLARFMLWLGIGATIGANIAFGVGYGLLGALISAWPAVACSQAGQDGGYQLTSLMTVYGLLVEVVEHGGVLGYLVRPGDLDCRSGGFERDGIVVEDPESDGGDRAPLDASWDDGD